MANLKELSQKGTDAFNAHDADALAELGAEDIVATMPGSPERRTLRGREESREYNQSWFDAFPDARITVVRETIGEESVATEAIFEGTNTGTFKTPMGDIPATGKSVKGQYCLVVVVKDGKFSSTSLYFDMAQLMGDLGLMPAPAAPAAAST
ncbi:MAG: ester cyclase [Candidatus Dormiibacterota bacterium]